MVVAGVGLPCWSEAATAKKPAEKTPSTKSASARKLTPAPKRKPTAAGSEIRKPSPAKATARKPTLSSASKQRAAGSKSVVAGSKKPAAFPSTRPSGRLAKPGKESAARAMASGKMQASPAARPTPPVRGSSAPGSATPNSASESASPAEVEVSPIPFSDGVLGLDRSGSVATPMIAMLGFGGTSAAAAASAELAGLEIALKPPPPPSPIPKAVPPPQVVGVATSPEPAGSVTRAAAAAHAAEPEPPAPDEPPAPPPAESVEVASSSTRTTPAPPPVLAAASPPVATSAVPPLVESADSAVAPSPGPAKAPSVASVQRTPVPWKARAAKFGSEKSPVPTDEKTLVKTSSTAAPLTGALPPLTRMPHPPAPDELAPKPPEKKGAAFAVPAAAGDLVIAANSQTDFQVKDKRIIFTGNVVMKNERFYLTADMLVAYMKEEGGLDFAEARGNVVVRMVDNGQETGSSGLSKTAVFHPNTGEIVLRGWPQVRFGNKAHVASSATTEMSLFTDGRMKTTGRNQTMIVRPPAE
jgi:lipopolysaccharide transport protein LptA